MSPRYVKWFKSYLSGRTFRIKIDNTISEEGIINNGIPQGSPLGPLLFNIFIYDITEQVKNSQLLLYADDLKVFREVNNLCDNRKLQEDLNSIVQWCRINEIEVNVRKTKFLSYTNKVQYYVSTYTINNVDISKEHIIKDLGVYFDSKLKFNNHIRKMICESRRLIGYIFNQWYEFDNVDTYLTLYRTLVRPKLEYASTVWNDVTKTANTNIESVQKLFIRLLCYKFKLPYYSQDYNYWIKTFNIESLEQRRIDMDRKFLGKIFDNTTQSCYFTENICYSIPLYSTRAHKCITTSDKGALLLHRVIRNYNELL